jgi:hypothetical protein
MEIYSDNDTLNIIHGLDESKEVDSSNNLPKFTSENIINWTLPHNAKSTLEKIMNTFDKLRKEGFSKDQAMEMVYATNEFKEEDINNFKEEFEKRSQKIKKPEKKINRKELVMQNIDKFASELGEDRFIELITGSNKRNGLVIFAQANEEKSLRSSLRNFKKYSYNQNFLNEIHAYVQPFVDDEFKKSTLLATKMNKLKTAQVAKSKENNYVVSTKDDIFIVDLDKFSCSCDRFKNSNFDKLGIPCEHIVLAQNEEPEDDQSILKEIENIKRRLLFLDKANDEGQTIALEEEILRYVSRLIEIAETLLKQGDTTFIKGILETCDINLKMVNY